MKLRLPLPLASAILAAVSATTTTFAATITWSGSSSTSSNWSDPDNWSGGVAPIASDDTAQLNSAAEVIVNGNYTLSRLTVGSANVVTIKGDGSTSSLTFTGMDNGSSIGLVHAQKATINFGDGLNALNLSFNALRLNGNSDNSAIVNIADKTTIETSALNIGGSNTSVAVLNQNGGTFNFTGSSTSTIKDGSSFMVGFWSNTNAVYNLNGGTLNAATSVLVVSIDGKGTFNIDGGTANLLGLSLNTVQQQEAHFYLKSGRLNLGSTGLVSRAGSTNKTFHMGDGTVGAFADWSSSVSLSMEGNTVFDTLDSVNSANGGRTIELTGALTGTGGITKVNEGTLKLSGINSFTGDLIVEGGLVMIGDTIGSQVISVASGSTLYGLNSSMVNFKDVTLSDNSNIIWKGSSINSSTFVGSDVGTGIGLTIDLGTQAPGTVTSGVIGSTFSSSDIGIILNPGYNAEGTYTISDVNLSGLQVVYSGTLNQTLSAGGTITSGNTTYTLSSDGKILTVTDTPAAGYVSISWASPIAAIGKTPIHGKEISLANSENIFLASNTSVGFSFIDLNGKTSYIAKVTGPTTEGEEAAIYGGSVSANGENASNTAVDINGDTWLSVEGGNFSRISGTSYLSSWTNSSKKTNGDIITQVIGNTKAGTLVGGSYRNKSGNNITGNVYLYLGGDAQVSGWIIGHSLDTDGYTGTHAGNVNMTIASVQTNNGNITGGNSLQVINSASGNGGYHLTGNINIDLTLESSSDITFAKNIFGGHSVIDSNANTYILLTGNSNINILATDNISFSGIIVGGSYMTASLGRNNITGNSNVFINGGSYSNIIVGGSYKSSTSSTASLSITGDSSLTIKAGTFDNSAVLYGGIYSNEGELGGTARVSFTGNNIISATGTTVYASGTTASLAAEFFYSGVTGGSTANFLGTISGYASGVSIVNGSSLIFDKSSSGTFSATYEDFDILKVRGGSNVTLSSEVGGLKSIIVESGSTLGYGSSATIQDISVTSGAKLSLASNMSSVLTITNSVTMGGTLELGVSSANNNAVIYTGSSAVDGTLNINFYVGAVQVGDEFTVFTTANGTLEGISMTHGFTYDPNYRAATLTLELTSDKKSAILKVTAGGYADLTWQATTGAWANSNPATWDTTATNKTFFDGDAVNFLDISAQTAQTVAISGTVAPGSVTINNTDTAYTFNGGTITTQGAVVKKGTGDFTLTNTSFTTTTSLDVQAGKLTLGASSSLIVSGTYSNSGSLSFAGGSLNLSGITGDSVATGIISGITSGSLIFGNKNLYISASSSSIDFSKLTYSGTGYILPTGANAILFAGGGTGVINNNVYYSGADAGLILTGTYSGTKAFSGSWENQTSAAGKLVIGSTTSSITTVYSGTIAGGQSGIKLGDSTGLILTSNPWGTSRYTQGDVKTDVVSQIEIVGSAVYGTAFNSSGTLILSNFNTQITGYVYGGGEALSNATNNNEGNYYPNGAKIYGSTELTLSGVYFKGSGGVNSYANQSLVSAGGAYSSIIYGNATLNISNSYIDSIVTGTTGIVTGKVTHNYTNSYFAKSVYAATIQARSYIWGGAEINDTGSTFAENVYGGYDTRGGANNRAVGSITINLTNSTIQGNVSPGMSEEMRVFGTSVTLTNSTVNGFVTAGSYKSGQSTLGEGVLVIDNSTVANVYGASYGSGAIRKDEGGTGHLTITIKGSSTNIGTFYGVGSDSSAAYIDGNMTLDIQGGVIGSGKTGNTTGMFMVGSQNSNIKGNATLTISGGTIANEYFNMSGGGTGIGGSYTMTLTGGTIESNIYATAGAGSIAGNVSITLSGGTLGKTGETRVMDMGSSGIWNASSTAANTVGGTVSISLDGGTDNKGTTFAGTYSILAGATVNGGTGVVGNTSVTLSNITVNDGSTGVANFSGVISGANTSGTGISSSASRTLTFSNYKTVANAQFKYFTSAEVVNASELKLLGTSTSIEKWSISGASSLTINALGALGGASEITLADTSKFIYEGASETLAAAIKGTGEVVVGSGSSASNLTLSSSLANYTGVLNIKTGAKAILSQTANHTLGKVTGTGTLEINNTSGITTLMSDTTSDLAGSVTVTQGTLELAEGVKLGSSTATVTDTLKLNGANLNGTFSSVTGTGTVIVTNTAATLADSSFSSFASSLNLSANASLSVTLASASLNSGLSIGMAGSSSLTLTGDGTATTLKAFKPTGSSNVIKLDGTGYTLTISDNSWLTSSTYTGDVIFDRDIANFHVMTGAADSDVYSNVYVQEGGIIYQAYTDSTGELVKLTLDKMTELPAAGISASPVDNTTYKITTNNDDLDSNTLTMLAETHINTLNIASAANNTTWDLGVHNVELRGGQLFFDSSSTEDYLITSSGGTITGSASSGKLVISQNVSTITVTIDAEIINNGSTPLTIQKSGTGKVTLKGPLSNTGGVQVQGGTLQLAGSATGSDTTGTLETLSTGTIIELGDGATNYTSGFDNLGIIAGSQVIVNSKASLGTTTVSNNGTIIFKEGSTQGSIASIANNGIVDFQLGDSSLTLAGALSGTGEIKISSGSVTFNSAQLPTQDLSLASDGTAQFNLSSSINSIGAISGDGNFIIHYTGSSILTLRSDVFASDWTEFDGTLTIKTSEGSPRFQSKGIIGSAASGTPTIEVLEKTQFWDDSTAGNTIDYNFILSGTGYQGTNEYLGALRGNSTSTYTGTITITDAGASIGGSNVSFTLSGTIKGGVLTFGQINNNYFKPTITLKGSTANTHESTVIASAKVIVEKSQALGAGVSLNDAKSELELKAAVELDFFNSTATDSTTTFSTGGSITLAGSADSNYAGKLAGTVDLTLKGTGTVGLSGSNNFSGLITMKDGSALNINSKAYSAAVTVEDGATLSGFDNYNGALVLKGETAGKVVEVTSSLAANSLSLGYHTQATVAGNINIANGGDIYLNAANANSSTAMITATGSISMGGTFMVNFDTDDYYSQESITYNVAKSSSGTVTNTGGTLDFQMNLPSAYEYFFKLRNDYLSHFENTGDLVVTIDVLAVDGELILDSEGTNDFTSPGQTSYLGAKEAEVEFTAIYERSANDPHYRITDGLGWFTFSPDNTLEDKDPSTPSTLIINTYPDSSAPADRGVVLTAADNTHTGGAAIYNVNVKSDADGSTGGTVNTFGTGEIKVLGTSSTLELTTSGNATDAFTYNNDILLSNGATLSQTNGANTITGDITIDAAANSSVITNEGSEALVLEGGIKGANLTIAGATGGSTVKISGAMDDADRTLRSLSLTNNAQVDLSNGANLTVSSFSTTSGGDIYINEDAEFGIAGGSALGSGNVYLNGGTLRVTKDLSLNGSGETKLNFLASPWLARALTTTNVIDVTDSNTLTVTNATAAVGAYFAKVGTGTILFTGNSSSFLGTAKVEEGTMQIAFTASNYNFGGSIEVGGTDSSATLILEDGATINGDLSMKKNSALKLGNSFVVQGTFSLDSDIELEVNAKGDYQGDIVLGENSSLKLVEGSLLGYDNTTITIGKGSTFHFGTGKGSEMTGTMSAPLTFVEGSTYEGFLNANENSVTFEAGSIYNVSGSMKYKVAGSYTGALQSKQTVTLNTGMTFALNNFTAENMERYMDGYTLISTSGYNGKIVFENGTSLQENADYSYLLGEHSYDWLEFALTGGVSGKTLDLNIATRARYDLIAKTANEIAIAPTANELANNFANYTDELKNLGASLALATGNAGQMLSNLALSTSSVMTAYQVQTAGLRRHAFDILNRASQEATGSERLGYEQHTNTIWVNAVGGTYKLDSDANAIGNTTNVWGGTFGYSRAVGENLSAGLAFTYTNSDSNMNNGFGTANVDTYYIDAFARYNKSNWNIIAILTGGFTSSEVERNMTVGDFHSRTKGSADGDQFYALLQAGYEFSLSNDGDSTLEPYAVITGGYASMDGFTESGAGNAGLQVDGQSQALCSIGAGTRFVQNFYVNTNTLEKGRFEVRALFLQDITDTDITVDANFIGAPNHRFSQEGMSAGKSAFIFGTGVVLPVSVQTAIFADVDAEFRSSETGVRANLGVRVSF